MAQHAACASEQSEPPPACAGHVRTNDGDAGPTQLDPAHHRKQPQRLLHPAVAQDVPGIPLHRVDARGRAEEREAQRQEEGSPVEAPGPHVDVPEPPPDARRSVLTRLPALGGQRQEPVQLPAGHCQPPCRLEELLLPSLHRQPPRALGHHPQEEQLDAGGDSSEADGDSPGPRVLPLQERGGDLQARDAADTHGDLVEDDKPAPAVRRGDLADVGGLHNESEPETCAQQEPAEKQQLRGARKALKQDRQHDHAVHERESQAAAVLVSKPRQEQLGAERANGAQREHRLLLRAACHLQRAVVAAGAPAKREVVDDPLQDGARDTDVVAIRKAAEDVEKDARKPDQPLLRGQDLRDQPGRSGSRRARGDRVV
mmetsp:Transcript_61462/g.193760  ORF Transcript_61462/g.193760 Transcript_61462/m.193760 type:complete len:371 (-) Transcript_61462:171-1283(-)